MPVPTVPRRAGPPRKKPVKSSPEVPEASEERVEEVIATPPAVDGLEHKAVEKAEETAILASGHEDKDHRAEIHDEPQPIDSDIQHLAAETKPASSSDESKEQGPMYDARSPPATFEASNELKQEDEHEPIDLDHPYQPDGIDTIPKDQTDDDNDPDEHSNYDENSIDQEDDDHHVDAEPQPSSTVGVTDTEEEEEDVAEEEARRKRVAERLAKMGGINPFAAPLLSPPLPPSEETSHADSPVVFAPVSPSRPDIPTKRASLSSSHEVVESHPPPVVEYKVEEEQGEKEISDGK